jgi:cytochrome c peroxidase
VFPNYKNASSPNRRRAILRLLTHVRGLDRVLPEKRVRIWAPFTVFLIAGSTALMGALLAEAQTKSSSLVRDVPIEELPPTIGSLKGIKPLLPDVSEYIVDKVAAQQLGKALFWDTQVGSDGNACATCHFHAGADIRVKNQVNPGIKAGDSIFNLMASTAGVSGPNKTLTAADFPFHRLADPKDRESKVQFDTNDVFSSQGTFAGDFVSSRPGHGSRDLNALLAAANNNNNNNNNNNKTSSLIKAALQFVGLKLQPRLLPSQTNITNEVCSRTYDPANNPFHANNLIYRKVEPRQTPTNINAVFNFRQFWDGRANNNFNGVDPFGPRTFQVPAGSSSPGNPNAKKAGTLVFNPTAPLKGVRLRLEQRLIENSSLASQAVGPALSNFEMSCDKKTFSDLGRKLIQLRPLANQKVHPNDSILSKTPGLVSLNRQAGLNTTYKQLIQKAFNSKFWSDPTRVSITNSGSVVADPGGFTQIEQNFSLFWGLAIQEYESLLVSDDSPFDRSMNGDASAMSEQAKAGQIVFLGKGNCVGCHFGPLLSGATMTKASGPNPKVLEHMPLGNGYGAFYDTGFYNIGVRPTVDDIGVGATDPYGFDLSFARQFKWQTLNQAKKAPDSFQPNPCQWILQFWPCTAVPTPTNPAKSERDAVDGSFKTPILRNVGLTPPYFHNGGQVSLKDVVRFYSRGGDRRGPLNKDTSGSPAANPFGQINDTNLDPDIGESITATDQQHNALGLTETEMDYLVEFLLSLTDNRVACHSGVFDHPELPLPVGQQDVAIPGSQVAKDIIKVLPAVGSQGFNSIGKPCFPNSGHLFDSINKVSPAPLQTVFQQILDPLAGNTNQTPAEGTLPPGLIPVSTGGAPGSVLGGGPGVTPGGTGSGTVGTPVSQPSVGTRGGTAKPIIIGTTSAVSTPAPPAIAAPIFSVPKGDIHGFTIIGFIQSATVSESDCPGLPKAQWGGSAVINGLTVKIPCNTILQMPAATFTWADLFNPTKFQSASTLAPNLALPSSGSTFGSGNLVLPSTEIRIDGNIVGQQHVAGLVYVSQQSLNTSSGYITGFDYANGVIYVSKDAAGVAQVRLQINDANGRFSAGQSPDTRFNVDDQNQTIHASSGYPMCVPRTDPSITDDPLCPQKNRPLAGNGSGCRNFVAAGVVSPAGWELSPPLASQKYCSGFVMKAPPGTPVTPALPDFNIASNTEADSRFQAPFEVGDFITYSGTILEGDGKGPGGTDTVSVHTINANVGIFTQPDTLPAYIAIGDFRISTFEPVTVFNGVVQEIPDRIVLEAFVTDVKSIVDIYLVDADPVTGGLAHRWITPATMTAGIGGVASNGHLIDGGITTQFVGPQPGRVRIRANKAVPGILDSPTRYVRVVMRSLCDPANINSTARRVGSAPGGAVPCLERAPAANGLNSGQYLAPTFNFILPENIVPGDPRVPNNFWAMGFLVNGEGPGTGGLTPRPW